MELYNLLLIIPFILGIPLFLLTNRKLLYLILTLYIGGILYYQFDPFRALFGIIERFIYTTFRDSYSLFLLISVVSGSLLFSLIETTGAIDLIRNTFNKIKTDKKKWIFPGSLSTILFIDPNFSALLSGLFSKTLLKNDNRDKKKLAYAINTIPVSLSTLIPLTTFTPIILTSLNTAFSSIGMSIDIFKLFLRSIPYQFYNWFSLFFLFSYFFLDTDPLEKIKSKIKIKRLDKNNYLSIKILSLKSIQLKEKVLASLGLLSGMLPVFATIAIALLFSHKNSVGVLPFHIFNKTPQIIASSFFIGIITVTIFMQVSNVIISVQKNKSQLTNVFDLNLISNKINTRFILTFLYLIFSLSITQMANLINADNLYSLLVFSSTNPLFIPFFAFIISGTLSFLSGSGILAISIMIPLFITSLNTIPQQSMVIGNLGVATIGAVISGGVFGQINSPLSPSFLISTASSEIPIEMHFGNQIINSLIIFIITCFIYFLSYLFKINSIMGLLIGIIIIGLIFIFKLKDKINIIIKIKNFF